MQHVNVNEKTSGNNGSGNPIRQTHCLTSRMSRQGRPHEECINIFQKICRVATPSEGRRPLRRELGSVP